jgi:hypothetical protein
MLLNIQVLRRRKKSMSEQLISLAEVTDRTNVSENGSFVARISALGGSEVTVMYTSPYASNGQGAFIAVPEVGVEVIVVRPSCSDSWYYMGSTFSPEPRQTTGAGIPDAKTPPLGRVPSTGTPEANRGGPGSPRVTGIEGEGLVIANDYAPGTSRSKSFGGYQDAGITVSHRQRDRPPPTPHQPDSRGAVNKYTTLRSFLNKVISLNDSPAIDSIVLDSGNGSTLKLTSTPGGDGMAGAGMGVPDRAFLVDTQGPQRLISNSQTDIVVDKGGRELQLLNQANDVEWGDDVNQGSVNIQSKWKDVNVLTLGASGTGRIFIQCLDPEGKNTGQVIQIETKGTNGDIIIKTVGNITLNAEGTGDGEGNININADKEIIMKTGKFSLDCNSIEVKSEGVINMDGSKINLAGGGANPTPVDTPSEESIYQPKGVTTYN